MSTIPCDRCGRLCQGAAGRPDARVFRRAIRKGHCTVCHTISILKQLDESHGGALFPSGPECLRYPHVQEQFAAVMRAGNAEVDAAEIDWDLVIAGWGDDPPKGGLFR